MTGMITIAEDSAGVLLIPVLVSAGVLGGYVGWLRPREARRSLRLVLAAVQRDLEADRRLGLLPGDDPEVRRFAEVLAATCGSPDRWPDTLQAPRVAGPPRLTRPQRRRLQRYVSRVTAELARYRRRARWAGEVVPLDVAGVLAAAVPQEIVVPSARAETVPARWTPRHPSLFTVLGEGPGPSSAPAASGERRRPMNLRLYETPVAAVESAVRSTAGRPARQNRRVRH